MDTELRIRVTKTQKQDLEKKAKDLNISLSAYVRLVLTSKSFTND